MKEIEFNIAPNCSLNFDKFGNLLCAGAIGTGKTYLLSFIIAQIYLNFIDVKFFGIDPKQLELSAVLKIIDMPVASDSKNIFKILRLVRDEMIVRYHKLNIQGIHSKFHCEDDPIFLVIDELIFIKSIVSTGKSVSDRNKAFRDLMDLLSEISVLGRQARVFVIISTQYLNTDYLPLAISENLLNRILLGNATRQDLIQIFGKSYNFSCLDHEGLIQKPNYDEPKIFIPYEYDFNNMINRLEIEKRKRMQSRLN